MDSLRGELDCSCVFAFGCATVFQNGGALLLFLKWGLMESRLPQNSLLAADDLPRVIGWFNEVHGLEPRLQAC